MQMMLFVSERRKILKTKIISMFPLLSLNFSPSLTKHNKKTVKEQLKYRISPAMQTSLVFYGHMNQFIDKGLLPVSCIIVNNLLNLAAPVELSL